jgi:hypothetical protein
MAEWWQQGFAYAHEKFNSNSSPLPQKKELY